MKCKLLFLTHWAIKCSWYEDSKLVAKSGQAEILKLLFWTGIFEILAKTLLLGSVLACFTGNRDTQNNCLSSMDQPDTPARLIEPQFQIDS